MRRRQGAAPPGLGKYNHNHDEQGRFATADDAVEVVGHPTRKPRPQGVQVASKDAVMPDASGTAVAQIIEPEPPPPPEPAETPSPAETAPASPTASSLEEIANGKFPGVAKSLGSPRTMHASDDPASEAQTYIRGLTAGKTYVGD